MRFAFIMRPLSVIIAMITVLTASSQADQGSQFTTTPLLSSAASVTGYTDSGKFVTMTHRRGATQVIIYNENLGVEREFEIPNGFQRAPMPSHIRGEEKGFIISQHIFNNDDYYEVVFPGGVIVNEKGEFTGFTGYDKTFQYYFSSGSYQIYKSPKDKYYLISDKVYSLLQTDKSQSASKIYTSTIPSWMKQVFCISNGISHIDYGYPSVMLALDSYGTDVVSDYDGYNWYNTCLDYQTRCSGMKDQYYIDIIIWQQYVGVIDMANHLIRNYSRDINTDEAAVQIVAQAYGWRAWANFALAQLTQFTYAFNTDRLCIPLINEDNATSPSVYRATVHEAYQSILHDLEKCIELVDDTSRAFKALAEGNVKTLISPAAAHGILARVALVMRDYSKAYEEAEQAIELSGAKPYTYDEIHPCSMCDINDASWMWGLEYDMDEVAINNTVASFSSHMSTFYPHGYTSTTPGVVKRINKALYESLSETDSRRKWFIGDASFFKDSENAEFARAIRAIHNRIYRYSNIKFAPNKAQTYSGELNSAVDIPLMRIEEMYYIMAEALVMYERVEEGKEVLRNFVMSYRDPYYVINMNTATDVIDEIWRQRRIEFWGEGISFFDLMRLRKGVKRQGGGYDQIYRFNINHDDELLLLPFPAKEIEQNEALNDEDQPGGVMPEYIYEDDEPELIYIN